jgi:putative transposase
LTFLFPETNEKTSTLSPPFPRLGGYDAAMPWGLKRYQEARCLHFVTFSCHARAPRLATPHARDVFEKTFEDTRQWYGFYIAGYVVMPEHVHLLLTEPERTKLSIGLQMLKQNVAQRLRGPEGGPLWQPRYYDFNVWSYAKQTEKLSYIHRNPVRRGLVQSPEEWAWSSFRHYLTGAEGTVEIESHWTARKRERMGVVAH